MYVRQCRCQVHVYAAMPLASTCICGNANGKFMYMRQCRWEVSPQEQPDRSRTRFTVFACAGIGQHTWLGFRVLGGETHENFLREANLSVEFLLKLKRSRRGKRANTSDCDRAQTPTAEVTSSGSKSRTLRYHCCVNCSRRFARPEFPNDRASPLARNKFICRVLTRA